jgi:hypothetical protein
MSDNTNLVNEPVKQSFVKSVFSFDENSRADYLNIIQYTLMAIIPILILNKVVGYVMPMVDENKGSLELSLEVIIQSILLFIGILIINKAIRYFPTYSGINYQPMDMISLVPIFLVIMLSLQTRIGQKSAIVVDRVLELINDKTGVNLDTKTKPSNKKQAKQTQPSQGHPSVPTTLPSRQQPVGGNQQIANAMSGGGAGTTSLSSLPTNSASGSYSGPDFNSMYAGPDISYPNSQTPGSGLQGDLLGNNEPMAANSVLGGFGTAF